MWCVPEINTEFVARMEDVLELYARPYRPKEPVVCLDERPVQLLDPARADVPMRPGRTRRSDYEYVREGTANIFCIIEPLTGRRLTYGSANRTGRAFTRALERIARRYPRARKIHLVMDNLSTHSANSLKTTLGERKRDSDSGDDSKCTTRPSMRAGSTLPRWRPVWCRENASEARGSAICTP